jgi:hypothetical protein
MIVLIATLLEFRFGSLADITARSRDLRLIPDSGHPSVRLDGWRVPQAQA